MKKIFVSYYFPITRDHNSRKYFENLYREDLEKIVDALKYNENEVYCFLIDGYRQMPKGKKVQDDYDHVILYVREMLPEYDTAVHGELKRARRKKQPITLLAPSHVHLNGILEHVDESISYPDRNRDPHLDDLCHMLKIRF